MEHIRISTLSKREVALRFMASLGIALALYYTPELVWGSMDVDARTARAVNLLKTTVTAASTGACMSAGNGCSLFDDSSKAD